MNENEMNQTYTHLARVSLDMVQQRDIPHSKPGGMRGVIIKEFSK
jgi:hypothetical protein